MRKSSLLLVAALFLFVAGCSANTSTSQPSPTSSFSPSEPTETPEEEPSPALPTWTKMVYKGRGDDVLKVSVPDDDPALVYLKHGGSSNFIVTAHDAQGERLDALVNDIGKYTGIRPVNFTTDEILATLQIQADGAWVIEIRPITTARQMAQRAINGKGDEVVMVGEELSSAETARITHSGSSNFIVQALGDTSENLVNEIGKYSGKVLVPAATLLFEIQADGNWSITFE